LSHDPALLDALSRRPHSTFSGSSYRATRLKYDPLLASTRGGRWAPSNGPEILYTSLEREGALAEIAFHWSQLTPTPTQPVALHTLEVGTTKTLRLIRSDLASLGVQEDRYEAVNYSRTQEIGAAIAFLGCDGLIAPNARWSCENLMVFMENVPLDRQFTVRVTETVDWIEWSRSNNFLAPSR
jgi:hypothetical protein